MEFAPGETRQIELSLKREALARGLALGASGERVPRVRLTLTSTDPRERREKSESSADGSFAFTGLPPGAYALSSESHALEDTGPVHLPDGDLRASILGSSVLQGRVLDFEGAAVSGAAVGLRRDRLYRETKTGSDGVFSFERLVPGKYSLTATLDSIGADHTVEVGPIGVTNFDLQFQRGHSLGGRVVDERGAPLPFARVHLSDRSESEPEDGRPYAEVSADGEGRFLAFQLADGEFEVQGCEPRICGESRFLRAHTGTKDLVVTAQTMVMVHGRVRTTSGVTKKFSVNSAPTMDAGGVFRTLVPRGQSGTLVLWAPGYSEVRRELGDLTQLRDLELPEISLEPGGELRGRIIERGTRAGIRASVHACPVPEYQYDSCSTTTDATGAFTLSAVSGNAPLALKVR